MKPEFTLFHLLLNAAERAPDSPALVDAARTLTYEELLTCSARLAAALKAAGLERGDRVGIYLEKSWEAVVAMLAAAQAGLVFVNISPGARRAQAQHIMRDCGVRLLIVDDDKLDEAAPHSDVKLLVRHSGAAERPERGASLARVLCEHPVAPLDTMATESDLATIIYMSGSTGLAKGVMLSHRNVVAGAQIVSTYLENDARDRLLAVLPLNFDVGLNQLTTMVRVGGCLVLQRSLLPGDILRSLREHAITGLAGIPPVWTLLLQNQASLEREPLETLRYITNTGGQIPGPQLEALRRVLKNTQIYLMYGLTEAFRSTYLPPSEIHRGPSCIGRAIPNTDVWVVDERGQKCAAGEVGELIHRGPTVALGYWGDAERTQAVYRPNPFAPPELLGRDLVVYSGDLVRRDEEGFLYYVGRRDELIKTQGYRVSPQKIEDALYRTGVVRECAAFGRADERLGQVIVAVVALEPHADVSAEQLRQMCSALAPSYMVPREIHLLDELPKNANGKPDRSRMRHDYAAR